jgi:hypothetical protein
MTAQDDRRAAFNQSWSNKSLEKPRAVLRVFLATTLCIVVIEEIPANLVNCDELQLISEVTDEDRAVSNRSKR